MEDIRYPGPGQPVLVKENPATYLLDDANRALAVARDARARGDQETEASAARSAVFLCFTALEGLINFVYAYSQVDERMWARWSTVAKWLRAPGACLPGHGTLRDADGTVMHRPGEPIAQFDDGSDLVARFKELRDARNAMVHAQAKFDVVAQEAVEDHLARTGTLPLTGLPLRLANYRVDHAETAFSIFEAMTQRLDQCMKGLVRELTEARALLEWQIDDDGQGCDGDAG
jgi:hypothetical protein